MKKIYKKHNSFISLKGKYSEDYKDFLKKFNIILKTSSLDKFDSNEKKIITNIKNDISIDEKDNKDGLIKFQIKQNVIDEIKTIEFLIF